MNTRKQSATSSVFIAVALAVLCTFGYPQRLKDNEGNLRKNESASQEANLGGQEIQTTIQSVGKQQKVVRDVYVCLMRYHTAARDEQAATSGVSYAPEDYVIFELRNVHSGPIEEITDRPIAELVTTGTGEVLKVTGRHLQYGKGPKHAYYDLEWSNSLSSTSDSETVAEFIRSTGDKLGSVDRYTSYEVTVRLAGKARTYRAIALHRSQPRSNGKAKVEILDRVTSDMNTVLHEESPRVRSPWNTYVKTSLYVAVAREISDKEKAGHPLIPKDAPIGYLPGDDAVPEAGRTQISATSACPATTVTFQKADGTPLPSPFRIAFGSDRKQTLKAVVAPVSEAANVRISASDKLEISVRGTSNGVITFDAAGMTQSNNRGDATITAATTSGSALQTASVSVVVPGKVGTPHDTTGGGVVVTNRVLDATTTPPATGVPPGMVALVTLYMKVLTVTVVDQRGDSLGDLYQGAGISEADTSGVLVAINQQLSSSGTYSDPVGDGVVSALVARDSAEARQWPTQPALPWTATKSFTQNFAVFVDNFRLDPGVVNRTASLSPPNNVTITWP